MDTIVINGSNPQQCRVEATAYRFDSHGHAEATSLPVAAPYPQAREQSEFYVPDLLRDEEYEVRPEFYAAAQDHAQHLFEAERLVDKVLILSHVLRASLFDAADERAMQVETVLELVEQKLDEARLRLDKHRVSHANLFIAYVEHKDRPYA